MSRDRAFVGGELIHLVGTEERVDPAWEQAHANGTRERWDDEATQRDIARRARREQQRPGERLDVALYAIARLQGGRTTQFEAQPGRSAESPAGPPPADTLDIDGHLVVIMARIREVERELDHYLGLSAAPSLAVLGTQEKDKLICSSRFEGWRPEDMSEAHPELGSPRTIQRIRSKWGLRGINGRPKEDRRSA